MSGEPYKLDLPFSSAYKLTPLYANGSTAFFGRWRPPAVRMDGDEKRISVDLAHAGDLMKYAYEEYGDPELFWAIAQANQVDYPPRDAAVGIVLIIPKYENVMAALQAAQDRQTSSG